MVTAESGADTGTLCASSRHCTGGGSFATLGRWPVRRRTKSCLTCCSVGAALPCGQAPAYKSASQDNEAIQPTCRPASFSRAVNLALSPHSLTTGLPSHPLQANRSARLSGSHAARGPCTGDPGGIVFHLLPRFGQWLGSNATDGLQREHGCHACKCTAPANESPRRLWPQSWNHFACDVNQVRSLEGIMHAVHHNTAYCPPSSPFLAPGRKRWLTAHPAKSLLHRPSWRELPTPWWHLDLPLSATTTWYASLCPRGLRLGRHPGFHVRVTERG